MKTNKIFSQTQYDIARLQNERIQYQNNKTNWVDFGTYGMDINFVDKTGVIATKHVNDWKSYTYKDLCKKFDEIDVDSSKMYFDS